jgi:NADH:ubiquinone oxidoreductase subunit 4 (subunit M)
MLLAGVLLKFSAIFIIRFGCVLDMNLLFLFVLDFLLLFIIGLTISCCVIVIQVDSKKIIAYLSVIHVNFSMLALLNMNSYSL